LLAAVRLTPGTKFWTRDKYLLAVSADLGLGYFAMSVCGAKGMSQKARNRRVLTFFANRR
jgi:hypothetical protein